MTLSLYLTFAIKITIHRKKINKLLTPVHYKLHNLTPTSFATLTPVEMTSSLVKWKGLYTNSTISLIAIMVPITVQKSSVKIFNYFLIVPRYFFDDGNFDLDSCYKQNVSNGNHGK